MHRLTPKTVKVILTLLLTITIAFQAKSECITEFRICNLDCDLTELSANLDAYLQFSTCSSGCTQISNYFAQAECYDNCGAELDDMLLGNEAEWYDCRRSFCAEEFCSCNGGDDCSY
ncbi:hypothetical protein SAMN05444359_1291 [Neolewinella agarilytica]|uniref:Uncharacterized protein n=1 Tax=Neolewinella agarilytica TaxID=478744 RepID=A0A1H9MG40_9BACT|nr:hypothetical protein SAMN05444359_1291 [Neolewinella agarilytica]